MEAQKRAGLRRPKPPLSHITRGAPGTSDITAHVDALLFRLRRLYDEFAIYKPRAGINGKYAHIRTPHTYEKSLMGKTLAVTPNNSRTGISRVDV